VLESAVNQHARYPAPAFYADPRVALAHLHLLRLDHARAWGTILPVVKEILSDGTPGRLLLEPASVVRGLLSLCPPATAEAMPVSGVLRTLSAWNTSAANASGAAVVAPATEIAFRLTEREREVLDLVAQGLPNKVLARQLSLSPHTVKRHLANILDKLDCDNRGQAANLWRRGAAGGIGAGSA
jgi:LuxR family maltose regulon positive regulatory protein